MFISVLIPTHNYKCYTLVADLQRQLEKENCEYEILVAEDGSRDQVSIIANHLINDLPNCRHIIRRDNIGRAAIRNFLVNESKGDWCIIIDSDAKVTHDSFIATYINATDDNTDVIVGGLTNPPTIPSPEVSLRYRYEKAAEYQRPASYRVKHPYERFSTFNFMAKRQVMIDIPFDEECKEYGYEDALMGIELRNRNKTIKHIDNPLCHMGFESNNVFLYKTETAIRTLIRLGDRMEKDTAIGNAALQVSKWHLTSFIILFFHLSKRFLRRNLNSTTPNLKLFAFYKLGYYISCKKA